MNIYSSIKELQAALNDIKAQGKSTGFVPTMGALHNGHLSLVNYSCNANDITVASIFVNPTQFNDKNDLKNYPRNVEKDLEMLSGAGCNIVFLPSEEEMYPQPDNRQFDLGYLNTVMEGANRPGHFNGVAQVVSKLFDIVYPTRAYFGDKDFQQLAVIKKLVRDYSYNIEIVPCPIIRENDGLAMSSRNALLSAEQRNAAINISKALFAAKKQAGISTIAQVKEQVVAQINNNPLLNVEYFEIVDDTELKPIGSWDENSKKVGCIAVKVGKIRLIDNIRFN